MKVSELIKQGQNKSAMLTRSLKHQVELYADKTHFVYELLQNAEDAGATQVSFHQFSNRLEVLHNGKPFTESNVKSLCDTANSDKLDNSGKIGKFGVGFKSVFSICDIVELYSEPSNRPIKEALPPFAIKIENYTDPTDIDNSRKLEMPYTTKFVFLFCWGVYYKSLEDLQKDVSHKLRSLGVSVLLFMKSIESISYSINGADNEVQYSGTYVLGQENISENCKKITTLGETNDNGTSESYLVFSKQIDGTERSVDIAFSIDEKQRKIHFVKSKQQYAFVYFPTETESRLDFIVQAPFDLTPNRSSLRKDSTRNTYLIDLLKDLLKEAILDLRDRGWLTLEFLSLLPYDVIAGTEWCFFKLHKTALNAILHERVLPTINGGYTDRKNAKIQRSAKLLDLFEGETLCRFLGEPNARWLPKELTGNGPFKLLHSFLTRDHDVDEIGSSELPKIISNNPKFFYSVSENWLVLFYKYLLENAKSLLGKNGDFATVPFVKTSKGDFVAPFRKQGKDLVPYIFTKPKNAHFSIDSFVFVDGFIEQNCQEFIRTLGLTEPNGFDYFVVELESGENAEEIDDDINLSLVKTAIKHLNEGNDKTIEVCKKSLWLAVRSTTDEVLMAKPSLNIYRKKDFNGVSLEDYFAGTDSGIYILDEQFYLDGGLTLVDLKKLEKLGVKNSVYINCGITREDGGCWSDGNTQCRNIGDFRHNLNLAHIESVLKSIKTSASTIAQKQSATVFSLLKKSEKHLSGQWEYGVTKPQKKNGIAAVIATLKAGYYGIYPKWVFTNSEMLVTPSDISRYQLNTKLYGMVDEKSNIYDLLGFKKTEQDKQKELINDLFSRYSEAEIEKFIQTIIPEEEEVEFDPTVDEKDKHFPEEPIKNLQKLTEVIQKRYRNAPKVEYVQVLRRIRSSRVKDKDHIRLRYRGYCQLCKSPSPYWEVAELFINPEKELEHMNLSLCPSCASEYRRLRNDEKVMGKFKNGILSSNLTSDTTVAIGGKHIHFTKAHLAEIKETLKLSRM